jgi:hypothetical protein
MTTTQHTTQQMHTRSASLREVVAHLDAGRPLPAVAPGFTGPDDLLQALHGAWSRRLNGRIDLALETDDRDLAVSIGHAWLLTAADLPGVRRVLDEHADAAVLRPLLRIEHRTVAVAAGLATFDDPARVSAGNGARFVAALRRRTSTTPTGSTPWWRRLAG